VSYGGLVMFPYGRNHHYKFAKFYRDPVLYFGAYCTFDSKGDVFTDGTIDGEYGFALSELPRGSKTFGAVTINQRIVGPGELQWVNGTLTVADRGKPNGPAKAALIYGFTIANGTGTEVSKTTLKSSYDLAQFWIQDNRVVGPESGSAGGIGVWDYSRGRAPVESIVGPAPTGIVISLK